MSKEYGGIRFRMEERTFSDSGVTRKTETCEQDVMSVAYKMWLTRLFGGKPTTSYGFLDPGGMLVASNAGCVAYVPQGENDALIEAFRMFGIPTRRAHQPNVDYGAAYDVATAILQQICTLDAKDQTGAKAYDLAKTIVWNVVELLDGDVGEEVGYTSAARMEPGRTIVDRSLEVFTFKDGSQLFVEYPTGALFWTHNRIPEISQSSHARFIEREENKEAPGEE